MSILGKFLRLIGLRKGDSLLVGETRKVLKAYFFSDIHRGKDMDDDNDFNEATKLYRNLDSHQKHLRRYWKKLERKSLTKDERQKLLQRVDDIEHMLKTAQNRYRAKIDISPPEFPNE